MKSTTWSAVLAAFLFLLGGCSAQTTELTPSPTATPGADESTAVSVELSDDSITADGQALSASSEGPVQVGQPLYNAASEGSSATAVVITQPGTYRLSGTLSDGQVAVDLGAEALDDPTAVVTPILDGVDITCSSAPALVFSQVYECADTQAKITAAQVDTSTAGARLVLTDGSENALTSTSAGASCSPGAAPRSTRPSASSSSPWATPATAATRPFPSCSTSSRWRRSSSASWGSSSPTCPAI